MSRFRVIFAHCEVTVAIGTPNASLSLPVNPTVQFNNSSSQINPSSLTRSLTGFQTFAGKGFQSQLAMTAGVFWRF